jgi:hypothetical protein
MEDSDCQNFFPIKARKDEGNTKKYLPRRSIRKLERSKLLGFCNAVSNNLK